MNVTQSKVDERVSFILRGIDVDVQLYGSVSYLWERSITFDHVKVRNITLDISMTPAWQVLGIYFNI